MCVEEDGDEIFIPLAHVICCGNTRALKPIADSYGNTFMRCPICNSSYGPSSDSETSAMQVGTHA